jgi:hypothetical protein
VFVAEWLSPEILYAGTRLHHHNNSASLLQYAASGVSYVVVNAPR